MKIKKILLVIAALLAIAGAILIRYQLQHPIGVIMFAGGMISILIILMGSPYHIRDKKDFGF
jgi:hypothetical protein